MRMSGVKVRGKKPRDTAGKDALQQMQHPYKPFFQKINLFWKMARGRLPERARAERGERTD